MGLNISIRPSGYTGNNNPHIIFSGLSTDIIWEMQPIGGLRIYPVGNTSVAMNIGDDIDFGGNVDITGGIDTTTGDVPDAFAQAMDEDLGIPQALAVIHEAVREGNQAFDDDKTKVAGRLAGSVRAMMAILGLDPLDSAWSAGSSQSASALSSVVESVLDLRAQAKAEKDFAQSDALRAILDMAGIDVSDGPTKSTWSIRG